MCCLFGMVDYGHNFNGRQKSRLLSILAAECEERGIDATGVAYNSGGRLHVYKRPLPAHRLRLSFPNETWAVMGHTRMATQGSEKHNYNNHPFLGTAGDEAFALAHNGILYNDFELRRKQKLPKTKIQTDSYVAVQLLEKRKALDFISLKDMAEKVEGSFTFTVLDGRNNLYFVKGDNPLCLVHFPREGLYLYASTDAILNRAIKRMGPPLGQPERIEMDCGELVQINRTGDLTRAEFDATKLYRQQYYLWGGYVPHHFAADDRGRKEYTEQLKSMANLFGYTPGVVDRMLRNGFTLGEIEEFLYCGEA